MSWLLWAGWPSQRVLYSSAFIMLNTGSVAVVGHSDDPDQTALGRHCLPRHSVTAFSGIMVPFSQTIVKFV